LDESRSSDLLGQLTGLTVGAHIAPDERRTHHPTTFVEHDGAVHLSGETDTCNAGPFQVRALQYLRNGNLASSPPIVRMLLGPANLRRRKRSMFVRCGSDYPPIPVHDQGAGSASPNVNPEDVDTLLLGARFSCRSDVGV